MQFSKRAGLCSFHNMVYRSKRVGGTSTAVVVNSLVEIDFGAHLRRVQLNAGKPPKYRKKKYKELDETIRVAKINVGFLIE